MKVIADVNEHRAHLEGESTLAAIWRGAGDMAMSVAGKQGGGADATSRYRRKARCRRDGDDAPRVAWHGCE
jgi:hypothetical protein